MANREKLELCYSGKPLPEEIIQETEPAFLRRTKVFGKFGEGGWENQILIGDNLRILKTLLLSKQEGGLNNADGSPGVRLIYIDPPFGTGDSYSRNGVNAYTSKLTGRDYLEWLRRRIVLLKEILSVDGSFYMRTDYHFGHYMKVLLDEIFGADKFRNEIIVNRTKKIFDGLNRFNVATDSLFFYTRTDNYIFNGIEKPRKETKWIPMHSPGIRWSKVDLLNVRYYQQNQLQMRSGKPHSRGRVFWGKVLIPPEGRHWTFSQKRLERYQEGGRIRLNPKSGIPEYRTGEKEIVDSNWTDIPGYSFRWNYPTENSEELLQRIITASSNPGDMVLDAFAGSGTTGAVAEKMGRRWIMIDASRSSAFTVYRRMMHMNERIPNRGKYLRPSPFSVHEAEIAHPSEMLNPVSFPLPFQQYVEVALALFGCEHRPASYRGIVIDGVRGEAPVLVYNWQQDPNPMLHEGWVRNLHEKIGDLFKNRLFIVAPASLVTFHPDSLRHDNREYEILRIPDSILLGLREGTSRWFRKNGKIDLPFMMNSVALDLIHPPSVKCRYTVENGTRGEDVTAVIKIVDFRSHVYSKKPLKNGQTGIASLAMVSIDYDYTGEFFQVGDTWQAKELARTGFEVRFPLRKMNDCIMVVYNDIFGNERKEVKSAGDFTI